jgi:hypothetical protein
MEDRAFKEVQVMTRQVGKTRVITSVAQAAEFIVNEWPGIDTERLEIAKHALVQSFDGKMSPGVARMAFIEAAKEAKIFIEATGRLQPTGKLDKWRKGKMRRRA